MAILIADQFLEPDEEDAETIMRKTLGEMAYKGPVSYITGVDVSTRLKLNDLFIQENRFSQDDSLEEQAFRRGSGGVEPTPPVGPPWAFRPAPARALQSKEGCARARRRGGEAEEQAPRRGRAGLGMRRARRRR